MKKNESKILKVTAFFLGLSWYMTWLVLAFYLVASAIVPLLTLSTEGTASYVNAFPVHFEVPALAVDPNVEIDTGDSPQSISIPQADGIVSFATNDLRLQLLATFGMILTSTVVLFVLFQLRKIVRRVREGKPFMSENLNRIRKINIAIFAYALLNGFYEFITSSVVQTEFYAQIYLPNVNILPTWEFFNSNLILLVLIILVIEQSFRIGLNLQEEKDLTI